MFFPLTGPDCKNSPYCHRVRPCAFARLFRSTDRFIWQCIDPSTDPSIQTLRPPRRSPAAHENQEEERDESRRLPGGRRSQSTLQTEMARPVPLPAPDDEEAAAAPPQRLSASMRRSSGGGSRRHSSHEDHTHLDPSHGSAAGAAAVVAEEPEEAPVRRF